MFWGFVFLNVNKANVCLQYFLIILVIGKFMSKWNTFVANSGGGLLLCGAQFSLFVLLQKSYETKQYKKGLKAADAILKKFPHHGGILFCVLVFACFYFFVNCQWIFYFLVICVRYTRHLFFFPYRKLFSLHLLIIMFLWAFFLYMCLFLLVVDRNFIDEGFDVKLHGS